MEKFSLFIVTLLSLNQIIPGEAFLEGFAHSISQMNEQLTKFMEGLQESVDSWADKVLDNAKTEECFYICPKGQDPIPKPNYTHTPIGCVTFGMQVKAEDLPSKSMKICCDQQQICYHHCNSTKIECDNGFQKCLHDQCIEISHDNKQVVVCETATKLLLMGILSFGCKTFKDAQRESCICPPVDSSATGEL
ncbi:phospholipase A2 group XII [Dermatophagoides farinae]|uniref:phospholipase A2 group XII n=1 Tax=Dermatophagoides farinae TaxID=6954 RepID=UPI003F62ABCD